MGQIITFVIIIACMIGILFSLGTSLYFLVTDRKRKPRTVKALTMRISLSLILFVFLIVAFALGWIQPHGLFGE